MNESAEHPLDDTFLRDALHTHVRESGGPAAGSHLVGLADGALKAARRRQRLARTGAGIAAAAVVAIAWVAVTDGAARPAHVVQPAEGGTGNTGKAALLSILPVTSSAERACAPGSGGYTVHASATHSSLCVRADRAGGMTDVRVVSAKAEKGSVEGAWQVEVNLGPADRTRLATLTGSIATAPSPRNGLALVVDGKLRGVPYVSSSITGGRLEIVGAFDGDLTRAAAHDLALRLDPRG
ncbi:SecDF P1 head subdomain-containing protein [Streptomyces fagopyri]|uniref:SecDF P1 head subdomain-containing protein n=1 Tax=Streptomyces fagopyri TaxID=2662397 RepID=UPI0033FA491E